MANGECWKCLGGQRTEWGALGVLQCSRGVTEECPAGTLLGGRGDGLGGWQRAVSSLFLLCVWAQNWPRNLLMACLWGCQPRLPLRASCRARQWGPAPGKGPSLPALWRVLSIHTGPGKHSTITALPPPTHPATRPHFEISLAPNAPRFLAGVWPNLSAPRIPHREGKEGPCGRG